MPTSLSKEHRKLLENTTAKARILAESACRAALENLAVHEKEYRSHMSVEQRKLRNRLRARGRALGDKRDERSGIQDIQHLSELSAYEHWHRLLFTRFLTENHLLITDEANGSVPVTLEDCEELAPELAARDGQDLACRFASTILPGVFRRDDPVLDLPIALNNQVELRKLLVSLPSEVFRADDSLGWTYQFWQAQRKKEVNDSGKKVGADELSPVTQLFTEDYMVEFLLHNTLGAWWAGKLGPIKAKTEEEARAQASLLASDGVPAIAWTYLRFVQGATRETWLPAAGTFDGWPKFARLIRLLDPCMGSGHFLVFALLVLVRLRMEEEKLSIKDAVIAVLKDNIYGLELDERCTQIAAFNVALSAWKLAGYQTLPSLHLACSGLAPSATEAEWEALAGNNDRLRNGMRRLHSLFKNAPVLGSLINPHSQEDELIEAEFHELAPLLATVLAQSENKKGKLENDTVELAVIAQGLAKAAELLTGQFTLVITNVPYLGRGKQEQSLKDYSERVYPKAKADLATCFVERCLEFCSDKATTALVTPLSWLFQPNYSDLREAKLAASSFLVSARLGSRAFETITGEVVKAALVAITRERPTLHHVITTVDATGTLGATAKAEILLTGVMGSLNQSSQLKNPDAVIGQDLTGRAALLFAKCQSFQGLCTSDDPQFIFEFWELLAVSPKWRWLQSAALRPGVIGGCSSVLFWEEGAGRYYMHAQALKAEGRLGGWKSGGEAWGKRGVAVNVTKNLYANFYLGDFFDNTIAALIPTSSAELAPTFCFVASEEYKEALRELDPSLSVTEHTLLKVPFDLAHWQKVAAERYPHGLPKPFSSDPTQWLFNGHPKDSDQPLHVAVARLLGYRWPRQSGSSFPDCPALKPDGLEKLADDDGIVCLPPLNREQPAAARLRQLLTAALGKFNERDLIASAGLKGGRSKTIEEWLSDEFFEQHAKLFHDRPFIWHIWDGRSDGFHALVNYHKLDHALLQKLTYAHLGNWIQQQSDDAKADKPGAADRLGAARELQTELAKILEGEAPYDLFVRWKPIAKQAQGWNPDLNDGVRMNIRPFLTAQDVGKKGAGLLRIKPNIKWDKDRGTEPQRPKSDYPWFWCKEEPDTDPTGGKDFIGNRWNNVHFTLAAKKAAIGALP